MMLDNYELRINSVIKRYKYLLFNNENMVGFGLGIKRVKGVLINIPCLTIYVKKKLPLFSLNRTLRIPKYLYGVLTDVEELGEGKLLKGEIRPAAGGISVGNERNPVGGTITCGVSEIGLQKNIYLLGCNHVLTRNLGNYKFIGLKNDEIRQPALNKGGISSDSTIGKLSDIAPLYVGINEEPKMTSKLDAAIAIIGENTKENQKKLAPGLIDRTLIVGTKEVKPGDKVYRIGAISGRGEGIVDSIGGVFQAKMEIIKDSKFHIAYEDVAIVKMSSNGGDSGAMGVVSTESGHYGFGMLVAGTISHTVFTSLQSTLDFFKVELLKLKM